VSVSTRPGAAGEQGDASSQTRAGAGPGDDEPVRVLDATLAVAHR